MHWVSACMNGSGNNIQTFNLFEFKMFTMKKNLGSLFAILLFLAVSQLFGQTKSDLKTNFGRQLFDKGWRFHLAQNSEQTLPGAGVLSNDTDKNKQFASADFNDSIWRLVDLPHDWSVEGILSPSLASCQGYLPGGIGWYRKHLFVPSIDKNKKIHLYFEGVYDHSSVFVNGHLVGKRPNGFVSFGYDISPYLKYGAENVIAVKVDHSQYADSRWYTGSGIYANVYLITDNPVHINQWGVFYQTKKVSADRADLNVQVAVKNTSSLLTNIKVKLELYDAQNKLVAHTSYTVKSPADTITHSQGNLAVKKPTLWGLNHPYLYHLKTQLYQKGNLIDQQITAVGIRTIKFDPDKGFALNGHWMKMKGVCIHNDAGVLGSAVPKSVWKSRLETLKELGCNAIRMSHNPHTPELYDLCDELGFLVMNEAFDEWEYPKKKWIEGWNNGAPGYEGPSSYFNKWSDKDIKAMVLRDRNHPSVVMWSIGNEIDYPNDPYSAPILDSAKFGQKVYGGYLPDHPPASQLGVIAHRLANDVRSLDRSRPVTAALAGVVMSNETSYPSQLDVVGYNYTENRYALDHKKYPHRILYGSETGQSFESWKTVKDHKYIFGQFIWTGIDYLGEATAWPSRGFHSGLIDLAGFKKPRAYFREALWSDQPTTYIGTYPLTGKKDNLSIDAEPLWNYKKDQKIRVVCYTNCQESKLFLNGKQVGQTLAYNDKTGILHWDLPFEKGQLKVIGYNGGKETCSYTVQTSDRPYRIIARTDIDTLNTTQNLAQIKLYVVDKRGVTVLLSDNDITCHITGPAKLLGLESGSNTDMGNYRDNHQRVYRGHLKAYIKATGEPGKIKVTFTSPWLQSATVDLEVVK